MSVFSFVKSKISILDVVSDYVKMKKMGGYWKGSCPFHQEADASFTVSPDKQIFYCFGCHSGGDVISFVAKIESMEPYEAVQHLLDKYNIDVPDDIKNDSFRSGGKSFSGTKKDQHYTICKLMEDWAHEKLIRSSEHSYVKKYLRSRSFGSDEWARFRIGYFPGGRRNIDTFLQLASKRNILAKDLIGAGLISQGRTSLYSPFEERILFPIRDVLGRCCGFGGRVFASGDERAKYYNSKESDWFSKGKLLFGLSLAKKEIQYVQRAFLVEGYTDCVAMAKRGYRNTIATLGTACTADHLKLLARFCKILYVLYDGDKAGQNAILRLTKLCWEANLELRIVTLPVNQDPASFLDAGGDLESLTKNACDIFAFFVNSLGRQFWGKSLSEKIELCGKIIGVVARIDDLLKRDLLLQQASSAMQIPFESLKALLANYKSEKRASDDEVSPGKSQVNPDFSLEEKIVGLVINSMTREKALSVDSDLLPYFSPQVRTILQKSEAFVAAKGDATEERSSFDSYLAHFGDEKERSWIIQRSFSGGGVFVESGGFDNENPEVLFEKLLFRFRKRNWKKIVSDIKQEIFQAKQNNDKERVAFLLSSFSSLKKEMKQRGLI